MIIFFSYTESAVQYASGYGAYSSSYIIVLALPAGLFQRIEAYDDIFKLTMTIRSHDG